MRNGQDLEEVKKFQLNFVVGNFVEILVVNHPGTDQPTAVVVQKQALQRLLAFLKDINTFW